MNQLDTLLSEKERHGLSVKPLATGAVRELLASGWYGA